MKGPARVLPHVAVLDGIARALVVAFAIALTLPAAAADDPDQRALAHRIERQRQALRAVEQAQAAERNRLLAEHLRAMGETLAQLQKLRPGGRMSLEELRDWMTEHQRLMELLMAQMMQEHHLLTSQAPPCSPR